MTVDSADVRTATEMLSLTEARAVIGLAVSPLPARLAAVTDSLGAGLASPILAEAPLPAVDLSAMDGYAVAGPGPWRVRDDVRTAGGPSVPALVPGTAVRIATGARLPQGADTVVRDEHLVSSVPDGLIARKMGFPVRDDVRRRGECWGSGRELVAAGTRVSTAVISSALSAGVNEVWVRGKVRAHVLLTGDEISRSDVLDPGQTRDTLGPILPTVLTGLDMACSFVSHVRDDEGAMLREIRAVDEVDVVFVVGSTGRGAADHLRTGLGALGATTIIDGIDIRPGGSLLTAVLPCGRIVIGLPGNPLAAVASLLAIGPALVVALTGRRPTAPVLGILSGYVCDGSDRTRVVPASRHIDGRWKVHPSGSTAHLAALVGVDALAIIPRNHCDATPIELLPVVV
nr:molybdopterin-binding protein [Rhodococcus sp. (in: high G+C Gram-positive bacteria)]